MRSWGPLRRRTERVPGAPCGRGPGRYPSRPRRREGADGRRGPDDGGSETGTSARCRVRASESVDSFPSEHPDSHADLLRGKARLQLDDRVLPVLADERVDLRDLDLEQVFECSLDLASRRLSADEELEAVAVLEVLRGRALEHVERLLCDVRMDEDLVRLHRGQLLSTSSAPSLKTVSRPGSPPGARTSAFKADGLTTSTPGRFPRSRRTVPASFTTTRRLRGWRYRRPRNFPRPARTCRPSFARSTSGARPN